MSEFYRVLVKHQFEGNDMYIVYEDKRNFAIDDAKLPDLDDSDEITFFHSDEDKFTVPFTIVKKFKEEGINSFNKEQREEFSEFIKHSSSLPPIKLLSVKPVEMHFEDITEQEMFDFDPIKDDIINNKDHGLWAFHGLRKFRFFIKNMNESVVVDDEEINIEVALNFNKKDNESMQNEIRMDKIWQRKNSEEFKNAEFFAYIDTNILGEEFNDRKTNDEADHRLQFSGSFEVVYRWDSKPNYTERYAFPVKFIMHNTNYFSENQIPCPILDTAPVSIDFGTSSTCVAVKKGRDTVLLTLSSERLGIEDSNVNKFENPTNIMIYRWEKIYDQWKKENESFPLMLKGNREDEKFKIKEVELDFGYTVKDVLEDAQSIELNSVLTQIKLIPYYLEQGYQLEVSPLIKDRIEIIKLVSSPEDEDTESFDPIAFYGYLLGRVINNPENCRVFTKFDISYPVKFNAEVRRKLQASLEYGLRRSLPLPLRNVLDKDNHSLLEVNMKYPEPVAYIGAICGKHLKLLNNNPELFAVYDFGGGTLDFSFGMFRPDEDDEVAIDIFGVDGNEKIGGESLISLISFWIYTDDVNKKAMIENRIPFELPNNEKYPDDFPEKLLNKSTIAKANVRKINELFSRNLFENKLRDSQHEVKDIDIFNDDNDTVTVNISVDYDILRAKLSDILEETIHDFEISMKNNFNRNKSSLDKYYGEFDFKKVNIFKSGNASRNIIVAEKMSEHFPENKIELIDEVDSGENKKYAITPKTAVAFGQLKLRNFTVNVPSEAPFKWYVGNENKADGSFSMKISKNEDGNMWVKYGVIRNNEIDIHYSDTPIKDETDKFYTHKVKTRDNYDRADFYIRIFDETSIEYCVCEKGVKPNREETPNETNRVELKISI